ERAVSARADSGRHGGRFHQSQARKNEGQLRIAAAAGYFSGDVRRNSVSGAGDADRQSSGKFFAGRSGHFAPRHGQEEKRRNGGAAREVFARMRKQQDSRE